MTLFTENYEYGERGSVINGSQKRHTGITTRIADDTIQELFTNKSAIIEDHYPNENARKRLEYIIKKRLFSEHSMRETDHYKIVGNKIMLL